jgi:phosphoglycerate dehydrogenase-like enzyme
MLKPKIVFADSFNLSEDSRKKIKLLGNVVELTLGNREMFIDESKNADIIVAEYALVDESIITNAEKLRGIAVYGVGTNHIDLEAAAKRGVFVTNTRGANAEAVAELTFSLILNCIRKTCQANMYVKKKRWKSADSGALPEEFTGTELFGKLLGIVGFGEIGKRVARIGKGFGMNICYYDPFVKPDALDIKDYKQCDCLDEMLMDADVVSVHAPLTADTHNLLNEKRLKLLKPSAVVIGASRGGIINEKILTNMVLNGEIAGAALDVFEIEPLPIDCKMMQLDNIILTPHYGGSTHEAFQNISNSITESIESILSGRIPHNLVNGRLLVKYGYIDDL